MSHEIFADVLSERADSLGPGLLYRYLSTGEADGPTETWTFAELDRRARVIGARLQEDGAAGERVLLLHPPGLEFVAGFFGCLYAGAIAVPTYPPDPTRPERTLPRLRTIAADAGARFVLTSSSVLGLARAIGPLAPELGGLQWIATDALPEELGARWRRPDIRGASIAFLQYTSGSTGSPRGVVVTHGSLLHNSAVIARRFEFDAGSSVVGWLPMFHDMGLIGNVLQPVYVGFPCTLMSPFAFLERPIRWLEAVSRFRATTSGGPNFAYELCARKATAAEVAALDLRSWTVAFNGAEPIRHTTLERFAEVFAPAGFRREATLPCYGLAESTLLVTGARKGAPPKTLVVHASALERGVAERVQHAGTSTRVLVSSGQPGAELRVEIVDPASHRRVAPGQVGEIWVAGPSVAAGYWNRAEETARTFGVRLADADGGPFLRTGDLGVLHEGEVFVTGRLKDLLIFRGRNHYPQDIERTAEAAHPAARPGCCAAFSVDVDGDERLVVALEVIRPCGDTDAVIRAVRQAILEEHGMYTRAVVLLAPRSVPKTSSGKLQRRACRDGFLTGTLDEVARSVESGEAPNTAAPRTEAEAQLARIFGAVLGLAQVGIHDNVFSLGLHSLLATQAVSRIRAAFGVEVPLAALFEAPTVARLAAKIEAIEAAGGSAVRAIRKAERGAAQPTSFAQRRSWFQERLEPGGVRQVTAAALRLRGALDGEALARAFGEIVRRHEVLRTTFEEREGEPFQLVHPPPPTWAVPQIDLTGVPAAAREAEVAARITAELQRPFDLAAGPLLRTTRIRVGDDEELLVVSAHHIVSDGWSMGVLVGELGALYGAFAVGEAPWLPEIELQYADFAAWQREEATGAAIELDLAYWREVLAEVPPLALPLARSRAPVGSHRGARVTYALPAALVAGVERFSRAHGVTPFMTLLGTFEVLLGRASGQDDFAVGTALASRPRPELEPLVGFFASTLALRANLAGEPTFGELLRRVQEGMLRAHAHDGAPFEKIVEELAPERDTGRAPIFQVMFLLQNAPLPEPSLPGLAARWEDVDAGVARFDLIVELWPRGEELVVCAEYDADRLDAEAMTGMIAQFEAVLGEMLARPDAPIVLAPRSVDGAERALERALEADPGVEQAAVLVREAADGAQAQVAYVALREPRTAAALASRLAGAAPAAVDAIVPVATIPLAATGEVDVAALSRVEVIEPASIERIEGVLAADPAIDEVAVVAVERREARPPLHLAELIPDWRNSGVPAEEPPGGAGAAVSASDGPWPAAVADGGPLVIPDGAPRTLTEALLRTAASHDDKGVTYVVAGEPPRFQGYADLLAEARVLLGGLRRRGLGPGDRVILQIEPLRDHFTAFWACVLGGITPVTVAVAPSYTEASGVTGKLFGVWELLGRPTIVASRHLREPLAGLAGLYPMEGARLLVLEDLRDGPPAAAIHESRPEDVIFIQLSSGSTGTPKCIRETHGAIVRHIHAAQQFNGYTRADVSLNWLPVDHVVPILTCHLKDVYLGCSQVAVKTDAVLADPLLWLDLLERYRVTHTWAPNFGFKLVVDALKTGGRAGARAWDLSAIQRFMNAGEQVTLPVVREFLELLAPMGGRPQAMQPAFGMAEVCTCMTYANDFTVETGVHHVDKATLGGALAFAERAGPSTIPFVDLGPPVPGVEIRIADAENRTVPEGTIGRLQIRGGIVTPGYLDNEAANREAFVGEGWFNSGDLGFLRRGRLTLTGREKEIIIVRGANFYCYEIEDVVNAVDGVEPTFAAAVAAADPERGTEGLGVFFVPRDPSPAARVRVVAAVRAAVAERLGITPAYVIPLAKAAFPKTTSGKIQRTQLKKALVAGQFAAVLQELDVLAGNANTVPDWFFERIWRRSETRRGEREPRPGRDVVFADPLGLGAGVAAALERAGRRVVLVEPGESLQRVEAARWRVDPREAESVRALLAAVVAEGPIDRLLHFWTYAVPEDPTEAEPLAAAQFRGLYSVLWAYQALAAAQGTGRPAELVVVSAMTQGVRADEAVAHANAPLLGLLRTLPQEAPWLRVRHLDLEIDRAERNAARVLRELEGPSSEPEAAYRAGRRLVPVLARADLRRRRARAPIERGGLYVITGGLGGIGAEIAERLGRMFAACFLLVGRTALPDRSRWDELLGRDTPLARRIRRVIALERSGVAFVAESLDVADSEALMAAVARAEAHFGRPLAGVLHLAGELAGSADDGEARRAIAETRERIEATLRPKLAGCLSVRRVLASRPNAAFVAFGSVAGSFGASSLGAYAAANAFLEAFIHEQRRRGRASAHCLSWSRWDRIGMAEDDSAATRESTRALGCELIMREQGVASLLVGLARGRGALIIGLDGSHPVILRQGREASCRARALVAAFTRRAGSGRGPEAPDVRDRFGTAVRCELVEISTMPRDERGRIDRVSLAAAIEEDPRAAGEKVAPRTEVERRLAALWVELLGVGRIGVHDSFFALGGHSLLATQLIARIEQCFGIRLPVRALFEARMLGDLAGVVEIALRVAHPAPAGGCEDLESGEV